MLLTPGHGTHTRVVLSKEIISLEVAQILREPVVTNWKTSRAYTYNHIPLSFETGQYFTFPGKMTVINYFCLENTVIKECRMKQ